MRLSGTHFSLSAQAKRFLIFNSRLPFALGWRIPAVYRIDHVLATGLK